jgi:hypothetical protein
LTDAPDGEIGIVEARNGRMCFHYLRTTAIDGWTDHRDDDGTPLNYLVTKAPGGAKPQIERVP